MSRVSLLIEDLKTSWYFRIYGLLWLVCAIVSFVGLVVLAHYSRYAQEHQQWLSWWAKDAQLNYPDFYVSLLPGENSTDEIQSSICYFGLRTNPQNVPITNCLTAPLTQCLIIKASTFVALPNPAQGTFFNSPETQITCDVNTKILNPAIDNSILAMGVTNDYVKTSEPSAYLYNGTITQISIEQNVIVSKIHPKYTWYDVQSVPMSNVNPYAGYSFVVRFGNLWTQTSQETDTFNGWMGVGEIGGFFFFLYVIHSILMAFIGLCLTNDSKFLGGNNNQYSELGGR